MQRYPADAPHWFALKTLVGFTYEEIRGDFMVSKHLQQTMGRSEELLYALRILAEMDMDHALEGDEVWICDSTIGILILTCDQSTETYHVRTWDGTGHSRQVVCATRKLALSVLTALYSVPGMEG
jgi:hypothetical protein